MSASLLALVHSPTTTSVPKVISLRLAAVNVSVMLVLAPFLSVLPEVRKRRYGLPFVVPVSSVSTTPLGRFVNSNDIGPVSVPLVLLVSVTVSLYKPVFLL